MHKSLKIFFCYFFLLSIYSINECLAKNSHTKKEKHKKQKHKKLVESQISRKNEAQEEAIRTAAKLGYTDPNNIVSSPSIATLKNAVAVSITNQKSSEKTLINMQTGVAAVPIMVDQKPEIASVPLIIDNQESSEMILTTIQDESINRESIKNEDFFGLPIALKHIPRDSTILIFGSDQGFDSVLLSKRVGKKGKIINVYSSHLDLEIAEKNIKKYITGNNNGENIEFCLWNVQRKLFIAQESVDICIMNFMSKPIADKNKVMREAFWALRHKGILYLADYVETDKNLVKSDCQSLVPSLDDYLCKLHNFSFFVTNISFEKSCYRCNDDHRKIMICKISALKNVSSKKFKNYCGFRFI